MPAPGVGKCAWPAPVTGSLRVGGLLLKSFVTVQVIWQIFEESTDNPDGCAPAANRWQCSHCKQVRSLSSSNNDGIRSGCMRGTANAVVGIDGFASTQVDSTPLVEEPRSLAGETPLNAEEIILLYGVTDPVYQGLIRWRMSMMQKWSKTFLTDSTRDILEIGTGNFPFSLALGDEKKNINFVGIERDPGQTERAKVHLQDRFASVRMENCLWNQETAQRMGAASFDLVSSFEVYEHVPADEMFIKNAWDVLRPGGLLIIETPNAEVTPLFEKVFGHSPDGAGEYEGNEHVNELSFRALFQDFRANGFEVVDFDNYYLPASLWQDAALEPWVQTELYKRVHSAAAMFPFLSYVQAIVGRKSG